MTVLKPTMLRVSLISMTNASAQTTTLSYQDGKLDKVKGVDGTTSYAYNEER